jgi:hypothetical protein
MSDVFVGNNDHGDVVPPTDVLLQMIKTLRTERDEARREVCDMEGETAGGALLEADRRGWDCFKEDGK